MTFLFIGVDAFAQDTKHADPGYMELDAEAVRVVMKSPKWEPGKKDGKPVRVTYTLPVMFYFIN